MARNKSIIVLAAYVVALCSAAFDDAAAQSYPSRSVTIVAATTPRVLA